MASGMPVQVEEPGDVVRELRDVIGQFVAVERPAQGRPTRSGRGIPVPRARRRRRGRCRVGYRRRPRGRVEPGRSRVRGRRRSSPRRRPCRAGPGERCDRRGPRVEPRGHPTGVVPDSTGEPARFSRFEHDVDGSPRRYQAEIPRIRRCVGVVASQVESSPDARDASLQEPAVRITWIAHDDHVAHSNAAPASKGGQSFARQVRRGHGRSLDGHSSNEELEKPVHFSER